MPRKTRQQKEKARQRMLSQTSLKSPDAGLVKREFSFSLKDIKDKKISFESTKKLDESMLYQDTPSTLPDIFRSLVTAASIIILELVLYFFWFNQA